MSRDCRILNKFIPPFFCYGSNHDSTVFTRAETKEIGELTGFIERLLQKPGVQIGGSICSRCIVVAAFGHPFGRSCVLFTVNAVIGSKVFLAGAMSDARRNHQGHSLIGLRVRYATDERLDFMLSLLDQVEVKLPVPGRIDQCRSVHVLKHPVSRKQREVLLETMDRERIVKQHDQLGI